jgi:hypothetical protein
MGLIESVKAQIRCNAYDTDHRLEIAITRMIERLVSDLSGPRPRPRQRRAA